MSELLNQTMRPDLYQQLPVDQQIMEDGLAKMRKECEKWKARAELAEETAREYRDRFCATIITKHEKLPWE